MYPIIEHRNAEVGSPCRTLSLPPTYDPHDIAKVDTVSMEKTWRVKSNVEGNTQDKDVEQAIWSCGDSSDPNIRPHGQV
jgi:hypothetical protein